MGPRSADNSEKMFCTRLAVLVECTAVSCVLSDQHLPSLQPVLGALCHFGGSLFGSYDGPIPFCGASQPIRGPGPSAEQAGQACVVRHWHGMS